MPLLRDDERLLHHALNLARAQVAFASPNPAVGCVITRGDENLGEGAHRYDLRDHAEIVALKQATALGHDVHGATVYVTLEPCSHHGRTGPCADALAAAGIARCVIATLDPNPEVRGSGSHKLEAAGIDVVLADPTSEIAQAARRLNDAFAFSIQHGRPFVTLKAAISADGKLAPNPSTRTNKIPHWITGPAARADVQQIRHTSDAILTGIGTVLADDPELTDRTGLPRRRPLLRIVLDSKLRTPPDSRLVRSAEGDLLLVSSLHVDAARKHRLEQAGIEILDLGNHRNPEEAARNTARVLFAILHGRGIRGVLAEGGSALNAFLLSENYADQVILYKGPLRLGPDALPFAVGQPSPATWISRLSRPDSGTFPHGPGQDIRTTGYLHEPWADIDQPVSPVLTIRPVSE